MRLFSGNIGAGIVSTLQMAPALQSSGGVKSVQEKYIFADFSTFVSSKTFLKDRFFTFGGTQMVIFACLGTFRRACVTGSVLC